LAAVNPAAFEPDLARSLWSIGWVHAAHQTATPEAIAATDEAIVIYQRLADRLPDAHLSDLQAAATTLADLHTITAAAAERIQHTYGLPTTAPPNAGIVLQE
jgi:hypothetical protein